jgi:hypothetical protein
MLPFAWFRSWLAMIYRAARGLNVELTDDIRGVFDRMLATDEAIRHASPRPTVPLICGDAWLGAADGAPEGPGEERRRDQEEGQA